MDFYTLTKTFLPKDIISEFASAIWTERYSAAGDVQLVVPASPSMIKKLAKGTYLGLRGTKEIMMLETQNIEEGLLTVSGQSLVKFLDQREAWFKNPDTSEDNLVAEYTLNTTAGQLISDAVEKTVINPIPFTGGYVGVNLDWARDKLPGLALGMIDDNGEVKRLTIRLGPLYTAIQQLAEAEGVGIKLYLESARFTTGYVLRFITYRGHNRTSSNPDRLVRLTPAMDSLADVKEVSSLSEYKNVVYVSYKNSISKHYAEPTLPIPEGFDRRVLMVEAEDIFLTSDHIAAYRAQTARDAFANNNYILAVDGQITPQNIYKFGIDYGLGDIIELEGFTGAISKARVTEYIRSQDSTGEKEYPTLSVIDPVNSNFMPDLEPDDDHKPDTDDDPDIDLDDTDDEFDVEDDDDDVNPEPHVEFPPDDDDDDGNGEEPPPEDPDRVVSNKISVPPGGYYTYYVTRLKPIFFIGPNYLEYVGFSVSVHGSEQRLQAFVSSAGSVPGGNLGSYVIYDPDEHAWMAVRAGAMSGDKQNLEFNTSPDGENWTTRWNYLAPVGNFDSFKITMVDYFNVHGLIYGSTRLLPDHPDSELIESSPSISSKTKDDAPFVFNPGSLVVSPVKKFTNGEPNSYWNYESAVGMDSTFYVQSWRANNSDFGQATELYIGIYDPASTGNMPVQEALLNLELNDTIRLRMPPDSPSYSEAPIGAELIYLVKGTPTLHEVKLGQPFNEGDYGPWVTVPVAARDIGWDGNPIGSGYKHTSIRMPLHTL